MPKHTFLPRPNPKKKQVHQAKASETADDFLALGAENEEAAEKWRAGDAAKSARFYVRALEMYERGLQKYPNSFDLAYNKARSQYTITQYSGLSAEFPGTLMELLNVALESHNMALSLDRDNVDVLFNTAQVMTSLAEAIDNEYPLVANISDGIQSIQLIKQAIELFQRCLAQQELRYAEEQVQMTMTVDEQLKDETVPDAIGGDKYASHEQEHWAAVVEPVTKTSLVETSLGLLNALTTLCGIAGMSDGVILQDVESLAQPLLEVKLPSYLDEVSDDMKLEILQSKVGFAAGLAELRYKIGIIDAIGYDKALKQEFDSHIGVQEGKQSVEILLAYIDAIIAFNTVISGETGRAVLRWSRLTKALDYLTRATKLFNPMNVDGLVSVNASRGDTELRRLALCGLPDLPDNISNDQVQSTLLRNASAYYRAAADLVRSSTQKAAKKTLGTMLIKEAITQCLQEQGNNPMEELYTRFSDSAAIKAVAFDMVEDSLVTRQVLAKCNLLELYIDT